MKKSVTMWGLFPENRHSSQSPISAFEYEWIADDQSRNLTGQKNLIVRPVTVTWEDKGSVPCKPSNSRQP